MLFAKDKPNGDSKSVLIAYAVPRPSAAVPLNTCAVVVKSALTSSRLFTPLQVEVLMELLGLGCDHAFSRLESEEALDTDYE